LIIFESLYQIIIKCNTNMFKNHNDTPALECQLKRAKWRDAIIEQIKESDAPKVLAIHGTWGTGKTSTMAQMYTELGGTQFSKTEGKKHQTKEFQPIWFEAWQYQHEENILAALLKEIRDQLVFRYKFLNKIDEIATVGLTSILQSVDLTFESFGAKFGFKNFAKNTRDNVKEYEKERFAEPLNSVMMKKMLKNAIDQLLKIDYIILNRKPKKTRKAVIFIDDLDRCEPDTAYRILESIKVYLDLDNCVFVLGMDIHSVEKMLAKHYNSKQFAEEKNPQELTNIARLYLEKICQDVYHLPILSEKDKADYFYELLKEFNTDTNLISKIKEFALEFNFLPPFPRSIKILANVILSHLNNSIISGSLKNSSLVIKEDNLKQLLIINYLYAFHYEVYHLVFSYPDFYNTVLLEYCKNPIEFETNKGKHLVLTSLIMPENKKKWEKTLSGVDSQVARNRLIENVYPHANMRQVFWIKDLVADVGRIEEDDLAKLKL